jgi:hypothetical protein
MSDQAKEKRVSISEIEDMSMYKYVTKFTQLSRYALHEVNTDEEN